LLLAVGAAALASAKGSPIHGSGALAHLWALFAAIALIGAGSAAFQLQARRYGTEKLSEAAQRFNRAALVVFVLLAVGLPIAFYLGRPISANSPPPQCLSCVTSIDTLGPRPGASVAVPSPKPPQQVRTFHLGPILEIAGIVVAVLIIVAMAIFAMRMLRRQAVLPVIGNAPTSEESVDEAELERAMLAGRGALEGEARAAIIACYAAMEESLSAAGVALHSSDSPADLLARAASGGVLEGPGPHRLAALFREARYSTHTMGEAQLADARAALDAILAQLTVRQEAAQAAARAARQARDAQAAAAQPAPTPATDATGRGRAGKR
jgi:hypothetical protein